MFNFFLLCYTCCDFAVELYADTACSTFAAYKPFCVCSISATSEGYAAYPLVLTQYAMVCLWFSSSMDPLKQFTTPNAVAFDLSLVKYGALLSVDSKFCPVDVMYFRSTGAHSAFLNVILLSITG